MQEKLNRVAHLFNVKENCMFRLVFAVIKLINQTSFHVIFAIWFGQFSISLTMKEKTEYNYYRLSINTINFILLLNKINMIILN